LTRIRKGKSLPDHAKILHPILGFTVEQLILHLDVQAWKGALLPINGVVARAFVGRHGGRHLVGIILFCI
jgi:hypothetical protein